MRTENQKIKNLTDWNDRLVGIEFENPVVDVAGNPATLQAMQNVWRNLGATGWKPKVDSYYKIFSGAEKQIPAGTINMISDNGAGNFEIALPPLQNIQEAQKLLAKVHADVIKSLRKEKLQYLGIGIQPGALGKSIDDYRVNNLLFRGFNKNLENAGGPNAIRFGNSLFYGLAAHQAGVSMRVPELVPAINEFIKIIGLVTALCGNSPIQNWQVLPWKEWRIPAYPFRFMAVGKSGFEKTTVPRKSPFTSLADFFGYYWDVPFMVLPPLRDGSFVLPEIPMTYPEYFTRSEVPARDINDKPMTIIPSVDDINFAMVCLWVWGKPHIVMDSEKATVTDFVKHFNNNTLEEYFEGRLVNCYLEARGAPASPKNEEMAIPALSLGLAHNLSELQEFSKQFDWETWWELPYQAAVAGIQTKISGAPIVPVLKDFVSIAEKGLVKRKFGEEKFLEPMKRRIETGKNPADVALEHFKLGRKHFIDYISYK